MKLYTEEELNIILKEQRERLTNEFSQVMDTVVIGLASIIEGRDNSTGYHVRRTSKCVKLFVEKLKDYPGFDIDDSYAACIAKAAPMHDLGKLEIPDAVLQKPGRFTAEEYEVMKSHSKYGAALTFEVLSETYNRDFIRIAINMAHFHHEKWDGSGYPKGLAGEDIPFEARVMAIADVFDALVSKRCYKDSFTYDDAFCIIEDSLATHFDPKLGRAFLDIRKDVEALYDEMLKEDDSRLLV